MKFVRKFRKQRQDRVQFRHILHELVLGAFLAKDGLHVRYEPKIETKTPDYRALAGSHNLRYVIAVFGDDIASVKPEELEECLFTAESGLFELYPEVSGFLFFERSWRSYL